MAKKTPKQNSKKTASNKVNKSEPRHLKSPKYRRFRTDKRFKPKIGKIDSGYKLFTNSLRVIKQNWKLFLVIVAIYGLLNVVLVRGVGGGLNLTDIKQSIQNTTSQNSQLATGTALFGYLLGSVGSTSDPSAGVYQMLLLIIMSLVIIWALRQVIAGHAIKARDAFYNGLYPFIQFTLVLLVVTIQLLPLLFGGWIYSTAYSGSIVVSGLEKVLLLAIFLLLAAWSTYMVMSSIFALYVVSLPNMTPMKALRSARALVKYRRLTILRKVLFLPFAILILEAIIMIPIAILLTPIAQWLFFVLNLFVLVVVHSYMYSLYRELL